MSSFLWIRTQEQGRAVGASFLCRRSLGIHLTSRKHLSYQRIVLDAMGLQKNVRVTITNHLLITRYCARRFSTDFIAFLHSEVFYAWETGPGGLGSIPKVTQLVSGRMRFQTNVILQNPWCSFVCLSIHPSPGVCYVCVVLQD